MNPLQILQQKAKVTPDGVFGPKTLKASALYLKITQQRAVHFFAQTSHETSNFKVFEENLNYSKEGLLKTFPKYFDEVRALAYQRNPKAIASRVYANRMGNRDEASQDGWKFRGRGALQLTGFGNYFSFSNSVMDPEIMENPDLVGSIYAFESAQFFFNNFKLWDICDQGLDLVTIKKLTKRINGGFNGLEDRIILTQKYSAYVGI